MKRDPAVAPINLDPHPAEGHSAVRTVALAGAVAEAVQALNYATLPENAVSGAPGPSALSGVVDRLQVGAARMDQLLAQLTARLADIAAHEELYVAGEMLEPTRAAGEAGDALEAARKASSGLASALREASEALSPIGVVYSVGPDD
jgi:hypothetical protein